MNYKQAYAEGLIFTGMACPTYDRRRHEECKARAKKVRQFGIRIIQVTGDSAGWVEWYAEPDYDKYFNISMYRSRLANADSRRQKALEAYNKAIAEIDEDVAEATENLNYLEEKYGKNALAAV